eukprot:TRINITY_DN6575_c0_g1_i1.p1 TRINITY_DN6575_c0_g1~~TRINITY_DN6575_c0_g1_i1.p1  ORF type:complete len:257 (-),score=43.85 TRINITY_DN6575_c0_g1_i1:51-821(-)
MASVTFPQKLDFLPDALVSTSFRPTYSVLQTRAKSLSINLTKGLMTVSCGLRDRTRPRPILWKGRVLSSEAIQTVQSLKRAKKSGADKLNRIYRQQLSRLVKTDLFAVLAELQQQNECELAIQVFEFARKEAWYRPDTCLYAEMIMTVARNGLIEKAEQLFAQLGEEGLEPDTRVCTELLGGYVKIGLLDKAIQIYEMMKMQSHSNPNELTFIILLKALEKSKQRNLIDLVKKDALVFLKEPRNVLDRFVNEPAEK